MCERIDGSDVREQRRRHGHEGIRPGQAESGKTKSAAGCGNRAGVRDWRQCRGSMLWRSGEQNIKD